MTANLYASVSAVKQSLVDAGIADEHDVLLALLIERASRFIDQYCKRWDGFFIATEQTRYYDGRGKRFLHIDPIADLPSTVEVFDYWTGVWDSVALNEIWLEPANAWPKNIIGLMDNSSVILFPTGKQNVRIRAFFGYSKTVPSMIEQITIMQTVRWFKRGQQGYQDVSAIPELGQLKYATSLDPEVAVMLNSFVRKDVL